MPSIRLSIIVPTRNRAEMAIRSTESALSSVGGDETIVFLSDNSTDAAESRELDRYVSRAGSRVRLVRPSTPCDMTEHWNFAVDSALAEEFTHYVILTDRMLFKDGSVRQLLDLVSRYPDDVLSYTYDRIDDISVPILYHPLPRSGELIRIDSTKLLAMSARMAFPSCLPRMLNSVSPREHLLLLKARFGAVFSSVSPDFNFCYRTLGLRDSILFDDRSLLINYAQGRSNGASFARGVMTRDSTDFLKHIGNHAMNAYSPLPAILTVGNAIVSEYHFAASSAPSGKFPLISASAYLDMLAAEVSRFVDKNVAHRSLGDLGQRGWKRTWRFRAHLLKEAMMKVILGCRARRFDTLEAAIGYARSHAATDWRWFPHPARKYGTKLSSPGREGRDSLSR